MVEKVGPFKVEFPTTIEVLEREELSHIKAQASGADNKIGSRMKIDLDVNLRERRQQDRGEFYRRGRYLGQARGPRPWHYQAQSRSSPR